MASSNKLDALSGCCHVHIQQLETLCISLNNILPCGTIQLLCAELSFCIMRIMIKLQISQAKRRLPRKRKKTGAQPSSCLVEEHVLQST